MRRMNLRLGLALLMAWVVSSSNGFAQSNVNGLDQTGRYIAALQNPDGGFAATSGQKSSLGATSSAVRILKYVEGSIKDVPGCIAYVKSCRDPETKGFAQTPGGKPDVGTTASGFMACAELKITDDAMADDAVRYFEKYVDLSKFEELRIAVAGLEALGKKHAPAAWVEAVKKNQNPDGTWGEGPAKAYATGSAAVALLRMGENISRENVLNAMREGQRPDGSWSKDDGPGDLGSTYRVLRGFYMLKEKPDLDRLRSFVAKCRQSDGSYSTAPNKPDDRGGTYFASIIGHWARQLDGEPALVETAGFTPLFNGQNLDGWEGDTSLWSAKDGVILGKSPGIKRNEFLVTKQSYNDFVLKFSFRLRGDENANSGVMFRAERIPNNSEMIGYQADIGGKYWGCLYDESRRNKVLAQASDNAMANVHKNDWNHYVVRAAGNKITLTLNGVPSVQYTETEPGIADSGRIGLQIHSGEPMTVEFKDLYIQPLPRPQVDNNSTPGFHLRTLKTEKGDRKYAIYLPNGYDGQKTFPAILFLHGSGERGDDGITPTQTGIGPSLLQNKDLFQAVVILPQAKETWAADSDDAKAALAALDDCSANLKIDKNRVVLTGLSMGGRGAWEMAAKHPERFAAVVPICGPARPETAEALKPLPVWSVVGDADRDTTVKGMRSMTEALTKAGAKTKATEYRAVGHNSWDRAYSDPSLIEWMLSAKRP